MNEYLVDTNILIYYFADTIPEKKVSRIEDIFRTSFNISIITKIEFLGWGKHMEKGFDKAQEFISFANVIPLTDEIADLTIYGRRKYNIKLPDAVIAATAVHNNLILVTRNAKDFKGVKGLEIYNPFSK
jgi:Predicted nucleic acid-binding protein, contains PIN domain